MKKTRQLVLFLCLLCFLASFVSSASSADFDILILNGKIVDGSGNPWFYGDVGIRDGRIAAIGKLAGQPAKRTIDAGRMIVSPGFLDMLGQSEYTLLVDSRAESKLRQGITTEITGEGESPAPVNDRTLKDLQPELDHYGIRADWKTLDEYFTRLEKQGIAINLATFVGATQVRLYVLGAEDRKPTTAELDQMKALVEEAMRQGALGVSSSLMYVPAIFSSTEELIELARVAGKYGGIYISHIRNEQAGVLDALEEAIRIGREAGVRVQIWHLKVSGQKNWGKMPLVVEKIERARGGGVDIAADLYPYIAAATSLRTILPPEAREGGDERMLERLRDPAQRRRIRQAVLRQKGAFENLYLASGGASGVMVSSVLNPALRLYQGKRLSEIAAMRKEDPVEAAINILIEDKGKTGAIYFVMSEPDVQFALKQPWTSLDTDYPAVRPDGILGEANPHPRSYGSFPRVLGRYVREQKLMPLEEAIRKMTSLPAQRVGLQDRGLLRVGMAADVAVFDPEKIRDLATFEKPHQFSEGVRYVIVNGQIVLDDGMVTAARPGRALRGPGWKGQKTETGK